MPTWRPTCCSGKAVLKATGVFLCDACCVLCSVMHTIRHTLHLQALTTHLARDLYLLCHLPEPAHFHTIPLQRRSQIEHQVNGLRIAQPALVDMYTRLLPRHMIMNHEPLLIDPCIHTTAATASMHPIPLPPRL